jgi:lysophospholipase L1-like esterase
MRTNSMTVICGAMLALAIGTSSVWAANIEAAPETLLTEPGFEADGNWKFAQTGAGVNGFFGKPHADYINAGLIDPLPERGTCFTYNNGPQHDLYQVLKATVAANTTYTLGIDAIDPIFANPFPGGELRLGYVSEGPTETDDYGLNLLKPTKVDKPVPLNDEDNDPGNMTDGIATWTYTFTTGDKPAGLGQKLRIEVLGGGKVQSLFDNVHLKAVAAKPGEASSAALAIAPPKAAPVVIMFGDSTTDRGMATFVKKHLDQLIMPELQRPIVINAGKGGDNATSALDRLEKDVLAHHPDIVTVSFGLNDTGGRNPDQFKESLKKIVKTLEDADIQVVLMTSTPFNNDRHFWGEQFEAEGGLDEYMDKQFCEKMRSLADGKEVLLCDLHTIFQDEFKKDDDLINKVISTDGVHLTSEGYLLVTKHIAPILHKLLTERQTTPAQPKSQ